jgi:hypothetical protein
VLGRSLIGPSAHRFQIHKRPSLVGNRAVDDMIRSH